jgi:hypothetical protein
MMGNQLIGGVSTPIIQSNEEKTAMSEEKKEPRCWLYKGNEAKIFIGAEIDKAKNDGWKDTPPAKKASS